MYTSTMSIPQEIILRETIREQLLLDPKYKKLKENSFLLEAKINEAWYHDVAIIGGQLLGSAIVATTGWTGIGAGVGIAITAASTVAGSSYYLTRDEPDILSAVFTLIGGFSGGLGGIALKGLKAPLVPVFKLLSKEGIEAVGKKMGLRQLMTLLGTTGGRVSGWLGNKITSLRTAATWCKNVAIGILDKAKAFIDGFAGLVGLVPGVTRAVNAMKGMINPLITKFKAWINGIFQMSDNWLAQVDEAKASWHVWRGGRPLPIANEAGEITLKSADGTLVQAVPVSGAGSVITPATPRAPGKILPDRPLDIFHNPVNKTAGTSWQNYRPVSPVTNPTIHLPESSSRFRLWNRAKQASPSRFQTQSPGSVVFQSSGWGGDVYRVTPYYIRPSVKPDMIRAVGAGGLGVWSRAADGTRGGRHSEVTEEEFDELMRITMENAGLGETELIEFSPLETHSGSNNQSSGSTALDYPANQETTSQSQTSDQRSGQGSSSAPSGRRLTPEEIGL